MEKVVYRCVDANFAVYGDGRVKRGVEGEE
jgi:hypothetical protein